MQKYTKYLFVISLLLSLTSLYIIERGGKEIYPFYSWKLFTSPSGNEKFEEQYRLYNVENNDTLRVLYHSTPIYDENNLGLITNFYGKKIEKKENLDMNIRKLKIFMKSYKPEYTKLILYKEKYCPQDLGKPSFKIYKTIITNL